MYIIICNNAYSHKSWIFQDIINIACKHSLPPVNATAPKSRYNE
jgi:hypothetical protein